MSLHFMSQNSISLQNFVQFIIRNNFNSMEFLLNYSVEITFAQYITIHKTDFDET